jgi:hypothetical protein
MLCSEKLTVKLLRFPAFILRKVGEVDICKFVQDETLCVAAV